MTDIIERMQSAADFNPGASAVLDEAVDEMSQLRARIAELEGDKDRATDLNRMLKRNNGALLSQKTAVEHVAKGYGWDEGSDHDQDALGFIIDRIAKLEAQLEAKHLACKMLGEKVQELNASIDKLVDELEAQRVPDGYVTVHADGSACGTQQGSGRVPDVLTAKIAERDRVLMRLVDLSNNARATIEQMRGVAQDARRVLELGSAAPNFTEGANWDAQACASMRDEIEYWKRKAAESDEALERIRNDLAPAHMGEPVIAAAPQPDMGNPITEPATPAEDIDQIALDLAKKVWAIGNRHGPDTQRKAEIQVALAKFLRARAGGE